jgi:Flp pilus assembly protein TadG
VTGRRSRGESGQALVEFALVLPLLLTVLLGLIDFGKAFNYWIDETHMANLGARLAAVNAPSTDTGGMSLQQYVQGQADTTELRNGGTSSVPTKAQVCVSFPNGTANVGDPVTVTVNVTYDYLPFIGKAISQAGVNVSGSATMRLEATPTNYSAGCS